MAAKKTKNPIGAMLDAIARLCAGESFPAVVKATKVPPMDLVVEMEKAENKAAIEHARRIRIEAAASRAEERTAEWAEHDRQEKEAATAIASSAIQLIPQRAEELKRRGGKGLDKRMAIEELSSLSKTLLDAQKARRIASGRPVEKTQTETNDGDWYKEALKAVLGDASDNELPGTAEPVGGEEAPRGD